MRTKQATVHLSDADCTALNGSCVRGRDAEACRRTEASAALSPTTSLDRQFQADAPNQKWVADFAYIWTAEGWPYAAAVLDLYSRRIVG